MDLTNYLIKPSESILDALTKIDNNNKGFLIVVDDEKYFLGTITDGDIRRGFIKGMNINEKIEKVYNKGSEKAFRNDEFNKIVELFKKPKIKFLPIIDECGRLVNVITKINMHVLLLKDTQFDLDYDFTKLDDSLLEHEIYNRPWGIYKTTFINEYSQSKIIKINPKGILSLQEHKRREEYWVVINGIGEVTIGESVKKIESGSFIYIPKGCKHRIVNLSEIESLMIAEVQLGDYFGEDDIIRYEDEYGRI
ncbi:CBS domain-containing protein [Sedimentibacter sp.]|uniref:CBS domain-containing protein n=1 Tax=Sedimentibacter sp. TaxID=1960295 RepID=UPI0028AFED3B|nr:CBS domain-containing protein [Sedimentibacter sp.]